MIQYLGLNVLLLLEGHIVLGATLVGETDWSIIFDLLTILVCLVLLQTRVVCLIVAANLMLEVGNLAATILPHRIIVSPLLLDIC